MLSCLKVALHVMIQYLSVVNVHLLFTVISLTERERERERERDREKERESTICIILMR